LVAPRLTRGQYDGGGITKSSYCLLIGVDGGKAGGLEPPAFDFEVEPDFLVELEIPLVATQESHSLA
jgi:hypothetical protein